VPSTLNFSLDVPHLWGFMSHTWSLLFHLGPFPSSWELLRGALGSLDHV
jgi:hypothetical protein